MYYQVHLDVDPAGMVCAVLCRLYVVWLRNQHQFGEKLEILAFNLPTAHVCVSMNGIETYSLSHVIISVNLPVSIPARESST